MAIQLRRDTAANWASNNPIPDAGQPCYAIDTNVLKIGNGVTAYNSLPAIAGSITSIVGITGTLAQFNAAITDADIQPWDSDLAAIAALTATTDNFMQAKAGVWASRTVAQVKTDLGLTGTNSGDQTTIVGITGTMAQFNAAITDGDIQPLDSDLTTIAGLTATTDSFLQSKASAWTTRTIAQVKTDLGLTGTNSGDQTTIVGITGTMAQFNTAITDGDIQPLDSDLTTIAGLTATTDNFIQSKASAWASRTIAQVKTDLGLTGTNSGDQTTIVGITGTLAQFNTAISDADIMPIAGGTFTGDIIVPAEVYGAGWSASLEAPTKKDLYDKIQTLGAGGGTPGGADTQVQFNDASAFGGDAGLTYNKTTDVLTINGTPFGKGAGVTSVLIGPSSTAGGASAVAIGNTAVASLQQTVAIGSFPTASGASAIAIGYSAAASGDNSIAIGGNSPGATRVSSIAIGDDANANQDYSIAIGVAAGVLRTTGGESGIAIGNSAQVVENFTSIAIGVGATVGSGFNNSMALGNAAQATASNQIMLGWNITQVVLGKSTAAKAVLDLTSIATNNKTFTFPNQTGTLALTANPTAITVPDEAYGGSWDGSMQVPTKNAIYDKIQTLGGGGGTILGTVGVLDNRLVRADGTGGVTAQGSLVSVSDVGTMDLPDNQGYRINGVYVASYTTGDDVMNINQFGGSILALNASTGTKFISPNLYAELNATTFRFDAYTAARVPMRIKLAASQTANAFEVNSSAGSGGDVAKITAGGSLVLREVRSPGLTSGDRDLYITTTMTGAGQIGRIIISPANTSTGGAGDFGGDVYIDGGKGDSGSGPGGWVRVSGGQGGSPNGNGGTLDLWPGPRQGSGTAGKVRIKHPTASFYGTLDMSLLTADRTFTFPDANTTLGAGGGGGMAIGGAVSGGTANRVLFLDGSSNLDDTADLKYDDTTKLLNVFGSDSGGQVHIGKLAASFGGIWFGQSAPDTTNYAFLGNTGSTIFNSTTALNFRIGNVNNAALDTNMCWVFGYAGTPQDASTTMTIKPGNAAYKGLAIKLMASQTGNAFEINSVSGSGGDLLRFDGYNLTSTGQFRAGGGGAGYGFSSIAGSHLYLCTSGNDGYIGFGNTNGQMTLSVLDLMPTKLSMRVRRFHWYAETPAQITSNQNDYQITYSSTMHRLSSDASRDITGIDSYASGWGGHMADSGEVHVLINVGSFPIVLKHESASSTAAYRFTNSIGADITLAANESAELIYDGTTSRWRVFRSASAGGGGGGMAIGGAVTGGTANRVPFIDGSGNLAQDADLTYDGTTFKVTGSFGAHFEASAGHGPIVTGVGMNGQLFTMNGYAFYERGYFDFSANAVMFNLYGQPNVVTINAVASAGYVLGVTAGDATNVPLRIKLAASHSANAFEINSLSGSGGDVLAITPAGLMYVPSGGGFAQGAGAYRIISQVPTISENSNVVATFSFYGNITLGNASNIVLNSSTGVQIAHGTPTGIGLKLTLPASQTANAVEVNSSAGSGGDIFKVEADGDVVIPTGKTYMAGTMPMASEAMAAAYAVALG